LVASYAFADPSIVRAMYDADQPLERRDMLLEGRFYGLRFLLGPRVGGVEDQTVTVDGRPVRRWSWNYRILRGHLEMGEMTYSVVTWIDTSEALRRMHRMVSDELASASTASVDMYSCPRGPGAALWYRALRSLSRPRLAPVLPS
jgi:hypothetical protein